MEEQKELNKQKRPLNSPNDPREHKKSNNNAEESISEKLQAIRVSCSMETHSYVPNNETQQQGPRYKPGSEASFAGTWNRGTTDVINMEIISFNGEDFKGSFKRPEARNIWTNVLGQNKEMLHGISFKMIPRKHLQLVFRLKDKVQIDDVFSRDDFSYNRGEKKPDGSFDIVCGRILGLRKKNEGAPNPQTRPPENRTTRVNLYGCEFDLTKEQVLNWMSKFGEIIQEP